MSAPIIRNANESDQDFIARLTAANTALAAAAERKNKISLKVSEKGGLSVYGLGRFPVTLYKEQWTRLLNAGPTIVDFIAANDGTLKAKGDA